VSAGVRECGSAKWGAGARCAGAGVRRERSVGSQAFSSDLA
jgi:hypothetical protein